MSDIDRGTVLALFSDYRTIHYTDFHRSNLIEGLELPARSRVLNEVLEELESDRRIIRLPLDDNGIAWKISDQGFAEHQSMPEPEEQLIANRTTSLQLVTPVLKDMVLTYLCQNIPPGGVYYHPMQKALTALNIDYNTFIAIFDQFQRLGFLEDKNTRRHRISIHLRVEAHDFLQRGGFVAQEEVLKTQLEKLMYELEKLQKDLGPDHLDKANKFAGILSAIASVMPFIIKK